MSWQRELFAAGGDPVDVAVATVRQLVAGREGATKVQMAAALNADAVDALPVALDRLIEAGEIHLARVEVGGEYGPARYFAGSPEGVA